MNEGVNCVINGATNKMFDPANQKLSGHVTYRIWRETINFNHDLTLPYSGLLRHQKISCENFINIVFVHFNIVQSGVLHVKQY